MEPSSAFENDIKIMAAILVAEFDVHNLKYFRLRRSDDAEMINQHESLENESKFEIASSDDR